MRWCTKIDKYEVCLHPISVSFSVYCFVISGLPVSRLEHCVKNQKHNHKGHKKCLQTFWSKFPQDHDHLLSLIRFASNTVLAFIVDTSLPHQDLISPISDMYVVQFTNVNKHTCTNTGSYTCTNINIQTCTNKRKIGGQCSL